MPETADMLEHLMPQIAALSGLQKDRVFIAISGPPACGKSTLSEALVAKMHQAGLKVGLVAMDGFHLDNSILDARGLRARKGAPETFDLGGFRALLDRLKTGQEVIAPIFDRSLDVSVGSARAIEPNVSHVVVEGNYLLLDRPGWRDLSSLWDLSVSVAAPLDVLQRRLVQRWQNHGYEPSAALAKAEENDLPNARLTVDHSRPADFEIASA